MSNKRVFIFSNATARQYAKAQCDLAPEGCMATFDYEPKKSRLQEEKYHSMIGDIAKSCKFMNQSWGAEEWKRLLIDAFVRVMREEAKQKSEPDPFYEQGQVVPALDGKGFVQLGIQSRNFSKKMAAQFIEYLYAWGTWNNAVWSNEWAEKAEAN
jgi:hypothetical protein